jgi:hypothetical protein
MLLIARHSSSKRQYNIPLCMNSIYFDLSVGIKICSMSWLLRKIGNKHESVHDFDILISIFLDIYTEIGLLEHL